MLPLSSLKTICLWSENPVKVGAVKQVFEELGLVIEVMGREVESGISAMPMSMEETELGSYTRAKNCMAFGDFDMTIWLEGGVCKETDVLGKEVRYLIGSATAIDRNGSVATGRWWRLPLPTLVIDRLKQWEELGSIMNELTQQENAKHKNGAWWFFTNDLITRQQSFRDTLVAMLVPRFHPALYAS